MKFVSIDIETTGLDKKECQILEIGAVIIDTDKDVDQMKDAPKFKCVIDNGNLIVGEPVAIAMNARIFEIISEIKRTKDKQERIVLREKYNMCTPMGVGSKFLDWLNANGIQSTKTGKTYITACGKNFGTFDLPFLRTQTNLTSKVKIRQRILDPANFYVLSTDDALPNLKTCMERCGIAGEVTHDALQDAIDTGTATLIALKTLWTK